MFLKIRQITDRYDRVNACEQCGKRFWKGYFMAVPSTVSDYEVTQVVCWRCRFLKRPKEVSPSRAETGQSGK